MTTSLSHVKQYSTFQIYYSNHHQGRSLILIIRLFRELKRVKPVCPGNEATMTFETVVCAFQKFTKRPDHRPPGCTGSARHRDKREEFTVDGGAQFTTAGRERVANSGQFADNGVVFDEDSRGMTPSRWTELSRRALTFSLRPVRTGTFLIKHFL